jgi:alpha-beta hydrolase superfamily lysophospholipase
MGLTSLDVCGSTRNCLGHSGFFQSWKNVRGIVIAGLEAAFAKNTTLKTLNQVVVTGHSLGGAVASIAALDLRNRGFNVDMASISLRS